MFQYDLRLTVGGLTGDQADQVAAIPATPDKPLTWTRLPVTDGTLSMRGSACLQIGCPGVERLVPLVARIAGQITAIAPTRRVQALLYSAGEAGALLAEWGYGPPLAGFCVHCGTRTLTEAVGGFLEQGRALEDGDGYENEHTVCGYRCTTCGTILYTDAPLAALPAA